MYCASQYFVFHFMSHLKNTLKPHDLHRYVPAFTTNANILSGQNVVVMTGFALS